LSKDFFDESALQAARAIQSQPPDLFQIFRPLLDLYDLALSARQDISWAQAEVMHHQTEGDLLFIQEVIRYAGLNLVRARRLMRLCVSRS
jgi:hypothetical protein